MEKINYVIKGKNCCGGESSASEKRDCCKDEHIVLKNYSEVTFEHTINRDLTKSVTRLFYPSLPFLASPVSEIKRMAFLAVEFPPPELQKSLLISTSILRI